MIQRGPEEDESTDSTETSNAPSHEDEYQFNVEYTQSRAPDEQAETKDESQPEDSKSEKTSKVDNGVTTESDSPVEDSISKSSVKSKAPKKSRPSDPLYWYGILVPPSLRTAQKSFADGIQNEVPALAAVVVEMRGLEDKVNKLRTEIGG